MSKSFRWIGIGVAAMVLLLLSTVVALLVSGGIQMEAKTTVAGRTVVARTASVLSGVGISSNSKAATARVGGQDVLVSVDEIEVVGVRKVRLPAECQKVELVATRGGVRILLDGIGVE